MKILLFSPGAGKAVGIGEYTYHNIRATLIDMGHEIIDFDFLPYINKSDKKDLHDQLKKIIEREKPDIFFHDILKDELDEFLVGYLSSYNKIVYIGFYGVHENYSNFFPSYNNFYDLVVLTDNETYEKLKGNEKNNVMFTQFGCVPITPLDSQELKKYDVVFIGTAYNGRPELLNFLKKRGVDIKIWGSGWENFRELRDVSRGYLPRFKMFEVMAAAKIVLNMSWSQEDISKLKIKKRLFEAAGCGAFQITNSYDEIFRFFTAGEDIVTYKNKDELLETINYYLNSDEERKRIAESAYRRALQEHSWKRRLIDIFNEVSKIVRNRHLKIIPEENKDIELRIVNNKPKVSVITYVYNGERYIEDAIKSVINQTYKDFEYLILDDGSNDRTRSIVEKYLNDRRLRYVYQDNIGSDLLHFDELVNRCVMLTKGDYVNVIGSDDIFLPTKLEKQLKVFEEDPKLDIVFSDLYFINNDGTILSGDYKNEYSYSFTTKNLLRILFKVNIIAHPTVLIKREAIEKMGGFETGFAADYHFWLKSSPYLKFKFMDEKLIKYRVHEEGSSTSEKNKAIAFQESNRVISEIRKRFTILDLFPEIDECSNKNKAIHDAYLEFGKELLTGKIIQPILALKEFLRALEHMENSVMAINNAAIAYLLIGDYEKAYNMFSELQKYSSINDEMRRNIFLMKQIISKQNIGQTSFIITTETINNSEIVSFLRNNKEITHKKIYEETYAEVNSLMETGRYEEVIQKLEKLLDFYPEKTTIYNDLGVCSFHLGFNGSALGYFEKALRIDPTFIEAKKNLINLYLSLGKLDEAIENLEAVLKQEPEDEEALLLMANIFFICNRFEDSLLVYQKIMSINPKNEKALKWYEETLSKNI